MVYGNCLQNPLTRALNQQPHFCDKYELMSGFPPVHKLTDELFPKLESNLKTADLFIYQEVKNYRQFSTDNLKTFLKKDARALSIPVIYFRGHTPEIFVFRPRGRRMQFFCPYNDYNILRAYLDDRPIDRILEMIQTNEFYSIQLADELAQLSLAELQRREETLDIPISHYIDENWKSRRLFNTVNHPKNEVIAVLVKQICMRLGVRFDDSRIRRNDFLPYPLLPVYNPYQNHRRLEYHNEQGELIPIEQYVEYSIRDYKNYPKDMLDKELAKYEQEDSMMQLLKERHSTFF